MDESPSSSNSPIIPERGPQSARSGSPDGVPDQTTSSIPAPQQAHPHQQRARVWLKKPMAPSSESYSAQLLEVERKRLEIKDQRLQVATEELEIRKKELTPLSEIACTLKRNFQH